jgi:hypothetical protein
MRNFTLGAIPLAPTRRSSPAQLEERPTRNIAWLLSGLDLASLGVTAWGRALMCAVQARVVRGRLARRPQRDHRRYDNRW